MSIIMLVGPPGSGKSHIANEYSDHIILSRDQVGSDLKHLANRLDVLLEKNQNTKIVLDNLHSTSESRKIFIDVAQKYSVPVTCVLVNLSIEDAQINVLRRQYAKYKQIFYTATDIKESGIHDPILFPIAVLFKFRKEFQKPILSEGFSEIQNRKGYKSTFDPKIYKNKALFLDYDGTLRTSKNGMYPKQVEDIIVDHDVEKAITHLFPKGEYLYLGVSNQSPIAKKEFTTAEADSMFKETNRLLFGDPNYIEFVYCKHSVPPSCYCRKPQSGMAVYFIEKYKLDPTKCTMIGDMTTDHTFAKKLEIQFIHINDLKKM